MSTQLYVLPDGSRTFDPRQLRRALLLQSGNKLNEWITLYNDGVDELGRLQAEENIVSVVRSVMGLKPLVENGVSDATVIEYIHHYLEWLSAPSKPDGLSSPIDLPCTDCLPKS